MSIISLKCSNCNGEIQLDDKKEFGFCMHCGHKILLQDSIVRRVEIDNSRTFSNWIKLGLLALESFNYESAENYGEKILEQDIDSGMGWYLKACGAMDDTDRRTEAHNCFTTAAENMSMDEKKEHGVRFLIEVLSTLHTDCGEYDDVGEIDFAYDAMYNNIQKACEIAHLLLDEMDVADELQILDELSSDLHDDKWTYCWEIISFIQLYTIDVAIYSPWSFYGKKIMEILVRANEEMDRRDNELPSQIILNLDSNTILEIQKKSLEYIAQNRTAISKANKIMIEDIGGPDEVQNKINRGYDKAEPTISKIIDDIITSYSKKLGKAAARANAIDRLPTAWNMIVNEILT